MKTVLVTGPSSGIGLATAFEMGQLGFHVVAAGRSEERIRPVVDAIASAGASAQFLHLDLASLESCRSAAQTFIETGRTLDVLINNAGVGGVRGLTEDGFEIHFGVNHLGHFMLTHHLTPALRPGARVVVVSSEVHRRAKGIDFALVRRKTRSGWAEYGVSKLANILFARELARRRPELRTYSVHPGLADTNIFPAIARPFFRNRRTAEEAARTGVWCATSDVVAEETGLYYSKMKEREPSPVAQDDGLALELWERSEQWCGVAPQPT
jgi:retinol dehydrogenase 12